MLETGWAVPGGSLLVDKHSCTCSHLCGHHSAHTRTSSAAQITTLLGKAEKGGDRPAPVSPEKIAELKAKVASQGDVVKAAKEVRCLKGRGECSQSKERSIYLEGRSPQSDGNR